MQPPPASTDGGGTLPRPLLRTLALCDLYDAASLAGQLGDRDAIDLIRSHDALVRELLRAHDGTEIDKSDGFLLLFERPTAALAFALAYRRETARLAHPAKPDLQGRVGIHMGEVLVWTSAPHEIRRGARAINVEGLAKPLTARLMQIARPGQILVSEAARGALRHAGAGTPPVHWRDHGSYRLKGLPRPLRVYEAAEPGVVPLRPPRPGPAGRPAAPAWRRLAMLGAPLAALLALVAVLGTALLRPEPAIAFRERDWVVLGTVINLTGDARFDASLDVATRTMLEQSSHINVLPDLRVRDTLRRMGLAQDAPIDRHTGSEIALREGARALLLPTLDEAGGRLRYSLEIIDPSSGATVLAESAEGVGAESALVSLGTVSERVRHKLGEALGSIQQSSVAVPQVTSPSIDALRAYSLGLASFARVDLAGAAGHYRQALSLDPEFALALVAYSRLRQAYGDMEEAMAYAERALALRNRLTAREALYVEAVVGSLRFEGDHLHRWRSLAELYPDFHQAWHNLAMYSYMENNYIDTLEAAGRAAAPQSVTAPVSVFMQGLARLGLGELAAARADFARAASLGMRGFTVEIAAVAAAERDFTEAGAILAREPAATPLQETRRRLAEIAFAVDSGQWGHASELADALAAGTAPPEADGDTTAWRQSMLLRIAVLAVDRQPEHAARRRTALGGLLDEAIARHAAVAPVSRNETAPLVLHLGYLLAREGQEEAALRALEATAGTVQGSQWSATLDMAAILRAHLAMAQGRHPLALSYLQPRLTGRELLLLRVKAAEVRTLMGAHEEALSDLAWLAAQRGRAYAEWIGDSLLMVENVIQVNLAHLRAAELLATLGKPEQAQASLAVFEATWPDLRALPDLAARVGALRAHLGREAADDPPPAGAVATGER